MRGVVQAVHNRPLVTLAFLPHLCLNEVGFPIKTKTIHKKALTDRFFINKNCRLFVWKSEPRWLMAPFYTYWAWTRRLLWHQNSSADSGYNAYKETFITAVVHRLTFASMPRASDALPVIGRRCFWAPIFCKDMLDFCMCLLKAPLMRVTATAPHALWNPRANLLKYFLILQAGSAADATK